VQECLSFKSYFNIDPAYIQLLKEQCLDIEISPIMKKIPSIPKQADKPKLDGRVTNADVRKGLHLVASPSKFSK